MRKIGGVDKIVKIDESKFRKRKYNRRGRRGRRDGQWVFRGFERGDVGSMFLAVVLDRTDETLTNLL